MFRKVLIVLISLIACSGLTYFLDKEIYDRLVVEDGIIENITAITMFVISVLLIIRLFKKAKRKNKWWVVYNILLALACFFFAGEEISWGQRIFSTESGEFFKSHNLQGETNLHNLEIGGVKINKWIFSIGIYSVAFIYFFISPFLYRKVSFIQRKVNLFGVQIPKLAYAAILLAALVIAGIIPDGKKWELWEAIFTVAALLIFLDPYNEEEKLIG